MNDEHTDTSGTMSSSRLAQFEDEVAKLKVTGGGANPERLGTQWGIGLTILGFVIAVIAWWSALDAPKDTAAGTSTMLRSEIVGLIGIGIAIVGIVIWVRNSLTRYLRYWIIRLVYEQREQTEQLIQALRDQK
jgi:hypothetical protein